MVNAEVLASGFLNTFISGQHVNRCKTHLLLTLALQSIHFEKFLNKENIEDTDESKEYLLNFKSDIDIMKTLKDIYNKH